MAVDESDIARRFNWKRIMIPILLGLGVATWLLISNLNAVRYEQSADGDYVWVDRNNDNIVNKTDSTDFMLLELWAPAEEAPQTYRKTTAYNELGGVEWSWYSTLWMFVALLMVAVRDLAYMYRIRVLTDYELTWKQSFDVIMLWEFSSAITPSVVGGAGVALFIVNREGIPMGKSTAVVMVTAMMDELFYILMVPVVLLIVGTATLFDVGNDAAFGTGTLNTELVFWLGYSFLVLLTITIMCGIFLWPKGVKKLLFRLSKLSMLKRFRRKLVQTGQELVTSSAALKGKPISFWFKGIGATFFSWTARFWVVNFLILAFTSNSLLDNLMIYAKQLVMWVIMLISPTPGGAGIAEVAFSVFLSDFIPVLIPAIVLAIIWRLFSYYPYLFIGALILPRWLKRTAEAKSRREAAQSAAK